MLNGVSKMYRDRLEGTLTQGTVIEPAADNEVKYPAREHFKTGGWRRKWEDIWSDPEFYTEVTGFLLSQV